MLPWHIKWHNDHTNAIKGVSASASNNNVLGGNRSGGIITTRIIKGRMMYQPRLYSGGTVVHGFLFLEVGRGG